MPTFARSNSAEIEVRTRGAARTKGPYLVSNASGGVPLENLDCICVRWVFVELPYYPDAGNDRRSSEKLARQCFELFAVFVFYMIYRILLRQLPSLLSTLIKLFSCGQQPFRHTAALLDASHRALEAPELKLPLMCESGHLEGNGTGTFERRTDARNRCRADRTRRPHKPGTATASVRNDCTFWRCGSGRTVGFYIARMTFISLKSALHGSGQPQHDKSIPFLGVGHEVPPSDISTP
ncbi:hypothetical protein K458DRAFT_405836 [Lentithecium fluviatile CBS 122367]|uniref:Uncharacterized protein n=1 Tax=Lentithecium fluviatile CBS 122367 TaxID=1168545 RepID=A0A6G1IUX9_9PLEO|nr:hypothetical protein K458DRAFT_405836 [Lentithecium fluviatile CBS 122367]